MSNTLWINGGFIPDTDAVFTIHDRVRYGDGVFDTMLAIDGLPVDLDLHLERLIRHAQVLGIKPKIKDYPDIVQSLLTQNNLTTGRAAINTIITRGESARGLHTDNTASPTIIVRTSPAPTPPFPAIDIIISQTTRRNEYSPLSRIKPLNYADNILAVKEAQNKNATDALLLNTAGHITCATTGNVFVKQDGILLTPPLADGVLDGITRAKIITTYNTNEQHLTPDDLKTADGVYITNSLRGAVPVRSLDGFLLPQPSLLKTQ